MKALKIILTPFYMVFRLLLFIYMQLHIEFISALDVVFVLAVSWLYGPSDWLFWVAIVSYAIYQSTIGSTLREVLEEAKDVQADPPATQ